MDWKRDHYRIGPSSQDGPEAEGLPPGKRTATGPSARKGPVDPGKRTPSQSLRFDPAASFDDLYRNAQVAVVELDAAVAERNLERAVIARAKVTRHLDLLRQGAASSRAASRERRTQVDELASRARPLLAEVPDVSADVIRARYRASGPQFSGHGEQARPSSAFELQARRWQESNRSGIGAEAGASRAAPVAVQRKQAGTGASESSEQVHRSAEAGVALSSQPLPHSEVIQPSFGRHDLSAVKVAIGGEAAHASRDIGATAYARGDRIAFATTPDLRTASHEAAHVIQQRHGVSLFAGVGAAGDRYEQHADQVADAVVAGKSVEPILDAMVGGASRNTATPAVQREAARMMPPAKLVKHWEYIEINEIPLVEALGSRLASFAPPRDGRLEWIAGGAAARFHYALDAAIARNASALYDELREILSPADAWSLVDRNRTFEKGDAGVVAYGRYPLGPREWDPRVGDALGTELVARMRESFVRMVPRLVAQLDAKAPDPVVAADLVMSHPIDGVVAQLLDDPRVVKALPRPRAHQKSTDPGRFPDGVRFLKDWRWLGKDNPSLWNWIEVSDPADAQPEEVAMTIDLDPASSRKANRITQSGRYFQVDPRWAHFFPDVARYMPKSFGDPKNFESPNPNDVSSLAASALATESAVAQVGDERKRDKHGKDIAPNRDHLIEVIEQSVRQLGRARDLLVPWKLAAKIEPASHWIASYRDHLDAVPVDKLAGLAPVFEGQQALLYEAVGDIQRIRDDAGREVAVDGDTGPFTTVLRQYAIAVGESHLLHPARAQLAAAKRLYADLPFAVLDESMRSASASVQELQSEKQTMGESARQASTELAHDRAELAEMMRKRAKGEQIAEGDIDLLSAKLREQALDARARALYSQLLNLRDAVRQAQNGGLTEMIAHLSELANGWNLDLAGIIEFLTGVIDRVGSEVIEPSTKSRPGRDNVWTDTKAHARAISESVATSERALQNIVKDSDLEAKCKVAIERVKVREIEAMLVEILLLIATSVAGGVVGSIVSATVRGAMLADAAVATVGVLRAARTAEVVGAIAGVAADATVNAAGQVMFGHRPIDPVTGKPQSGGAAFTHAFISSGAVAAALAPLHKVLSAWGGVEQEVANAQLWERVGHGALVTFRAGVVLTAEMITGAAVDYVVQRALGGPPPDEQTAASWAMSGASMAVGKFLRGRVAPLEARLAQLVEHDSHLARRASRLADISKHLADKGDKDVAMEALIEHRALLAEEARVIAEQSKSANPKLSRQTLDTLRAGNSSEVAGTSEQAIATLPLRLNGLSPDDSSGRVWKGSTEDIAIALHQASRAGLAVTVLDHDQAARQWRVRFNGKELTILETELHGQPRAAKPNPSDGDRVHAERYAHAARYMQEQWNAKVKAEIDARLDAGKIVEFDRIQTGGALGGVMNQATLAESGVGLGSRLVVASHAGTLSNRGSQELGQEPTTWDVPGVRTSEQAPKGAPLATSEHLDRALHIGRAETHMSMYEGAVVAMQPRPKNLPQARGPNDWPQAADHRQWRLRVRDAGGHEGWLYTDWHDYVGGMGPADTHQVDAIMDAHQRDAMFASNQLLRGEDPDYAAKLKSGEIFVWGGTPTGAWAAETVHAAGSRATVMGDTRPPSDWPTILRMYEEVLLDIASHPQDQVPPALTWRREILEGAIRDAHSGSKLPRNRKPGATYDKPVVGRGPNDIHIEFGTPTKLTPLPDGRVGVTVGNADAPSSRIVDQVVIAHGQDPSGPGGVGSLLGKGAVDSKGRAHGEVPEGTIKLKPVYKASKTGDPAEILALESVDPPGLTLKGAAYASKRMSPWVIESERANFEAAVETMTAEGATTRDHGPIDEHSRGVSTGVKRQGDYLPRVNEMYNAKAYRLPGPDHTLELDPQHPELWDEQVRTFFALSLRAANKWVRVNRLGEGHTKAIVYKVWVEDNDVGVFKLFEKGAAAVTEVEMLEVLKKANLKIMKPVGERGRISMTGTGHEQALLMDAAKGTSVQSMVEHLPDDPRARRKALDELTSAVTRVAEGLAEFHAKFGSTDSNGRSHLMTKESKLSDAEWFLKGNFHAGGRFESTVRTGLGSDFEAVRTALESKALPDFLDANVPVTAYHGDANAGNFILDKAPAGRAADLSVIDVGTMKYSQDGASWNKTGAADVARFLGSLESLAPGKLRPPEIESLRGEFTRIYFVKSKNLYGVTIDRASFARAETWYRVEMEVAALRNGDATAKGRILSRLQLESHP